MEILSNPVSKHLTKLRANMTNIRVGVELETQAIDGQTYDDLAERVTQEIDEDDIRSEYDPSTDTSEAQCIRSDVLSLQCGTLFEGLRDYDTYCRRKGRGAAEELDRVLNTILGVLDITDTRYFRSREGSEGTETISHVQCGNWEDLPWETWDLGDDEEVEGVVIPVVGSAYRGGYVAGELLLTEDLLDDAIAAAFGRASITVCEVRHLYQLCGMDFEGTYCFDTALQDFIDNYEGYTDGPTGLENLRDDMSYGISVDLVHDGSVEGPEIRIPDANGASIKEVKGVVKRIFMRYDLDIDEGCSFHVHVSANGHMAEPFRSERLYTQFLMLKFLSDNADRFPDCVAERVVEKMGYRSKSQYFDFDLNTGEKYMFVAYRGRTWEFRCFGNVSGYWDGAKCIDLAVDAFLWAHHPEVREAFKKYTGLENLCHLLRVNILDRFKKRIGG